MKRRKATNEKELSSAIKEGADEIEIEGDLANKVIRIKATGKVAWAVAIGAIAVAIVSLVAVPVSGGSSAVANLATAPVVFSVLGTASVPAITLAAVSGGVAVLNKLRGYKIIEKSDSYVLLRK